MGERVMGEIVISIWLAFKGIVGIPAGKD